MLDLFNNNNKINNLKIAQVTKEDVIRETDKLNTIISLLEKHENMYPKIDKWIHKKVIPGIKTEERVAYIGFDNEVPFVSAIVKKGAHSKFCHLHIDNEFRNKNIGGLFFSLMTLELKRFAKEIHFTLPESLWSEKKKFFNSFGFEKITKSGIQYRLFEEELKCSAPIEKVWGATLDLLPKLLYTNGIIMSINPIYCNRILRGNKVVEIRKKFNKKWIGSKVALYSTHPTKAIVGNATIEKVEEGIPENIWEKNSDLLGCTKREFDNYTAQSSKVYALTLNNIEPYHDPIQLSAMSDYIKKELKAPQSYQSILKNRHWAEAISITDLLHGRIRINQIQI
jgi:predicted transcriptional regulator